VTGWEAVGGGGASSPEPLLSLQGYMVLYDLSVYNSKSDLLSRLFKTLPDVIFIRNAVYMVMSLRVISF
jgi:hypothetical protein